MKSRKQSQSLPPYLCNINMQCCLPTGILNNATPQLSKLLSLIRVVAFIQLGFGVLSILTDLQSGLMVLIGAIALLMITYTKNWCGCVCYIVISIMDMFQTITTAGNYLVEYHSITSVYGVLTYISLFKIPMYVIGMYYAFLTYRELKALLIESGGGQAYAPAFSQGQYRNEPSQPPPPPQMQPFTGRGFTVG